LKPDDAVCRDPSVQVRRVPVQNAGACPRIGTALE
jgi:hypothetical protein